MCTILWSLKITYVFSEKSVMIKLNKSESYESQQNLKLQWTAVSENPCLFFVFGKW